ncbi:YceD family protein [Legionella sp.]|uniref:YceD family protein n=1 Tax=Legionella sp. TaxID=459 RepID=UPI003CAC3C6E
MVFLQEMVKQGHQTKIVTIKERLPNFIIAPCTLYVHYQVDVKEDFYLVRLHVNGEVSLQCQRCLDNFNYLYDNNTVIAVCRDEQRAEELLEHYECVVSSSLQICLEDLIIDELHLYAPQFHLQITDCSQDINQFLTEKNDSY